MAIVGACGSEHVQVADWLVAGGFDVVHDPRGDEKQRPGADRMACIAYVIDGSAFHDRCDLVEVVVLVGCEFDLGVDLIHHQDHVAGPEPLARHSAAHNLARYRVPVGNTALAAHTGYLMLRDRRHAVALCKTISRIVQCSHSPFG